MCCADGDGGGLRACVRAYSVCVSVCVCVCVGGS